MNPAVKYTLGRLGIFVLAFALLLPVPLNFLVRAMIALVVSAIVSYFLLADWRNQMNERLVGSSARRVAEKERLRAALAGDEDAAAAGDRAAEPVTPVEEKATDGAEDKVEARSEDRAETPAEAEKK